MPYDEALAARVRTTLARRRGRTEKKMFGGIAFLLDGRMCCGIIGDRLMVRVGASGYGAALAEPHVRPMDFTGRPMTGYVWVGAPAVASDAALAAWVARGVEVARTTAPKKTVRRARR